MGANINSDLQKCGELLIDIKKIKFKTKSYIYHCAFCSANCDQLKKFTKHLEDAHLQNFEEDFPDDTKEQLESDNSDLPFSPMDIKLEQHMYIDESNNNALNESKSTFPEVLNKTLEDENNEINDDKTIITSSICSTVASDPLMCKTISYKLLDLETKVTNNDTLLSNENKELCGEKNVSNSKDVESCSEDTNSETQHDNTNYSDHSNEAESSKKVKRRVRIEKKVGIFSNVH